MLEALGLDEQQRSVLTPKVRAMPAGLSTEQLVSWAVQQESGGAPPVDAPPLTVDVLLSKATALKADGNDFFKGAELGQACTAYQGAVELLTSNEAKQLFKAWWASQPAGEAPADAASPLLASLHTNLAACHNKLGQWQSSVLAASAALAIDATLLKARFRRGVAQSCLNQMAEAKADLTAVVRADPRNKEGEGSGLEPRYHSNPAITRTPLTLGTKRARGARLELPPFRPFRWRPRDLQP